MNFAGKTLYSLSDLSLLFDLSAYDRVSDPTSKLLWAPHDLLGESLPDQVLLPV